MLILEFHENHVFETIQLIWMQVVRNVAGNQNVLHFILVALLITWLEIRNI